ncbi:MAG TPA: ROK family protein [Candidatus Dormibacteraeota bacterium]|nr:ROK family protein [Candidatus Dormibacteraeota bacterium]
MSKPGAFGIDIGGTKTLCVLVDKRCRMVKAIKFKTAPDEGADKFGRNLVAALDQLKKVADQRNLELTGIGAGCAGMINHKKGIIEKSPNLLCLEGFTIGKMLRKRFRVQVTLGNDVQFGIFGEWKLGAASGCPTALGVFFGTGVGGAAIINHKLYRGASGIGGQVGAILAQPVGGPEAAQSHGILDRIASKAAIGSEALVMAVKDWAPYLHKKVDTDLSKVTWGVLRRAIAHGDKRIDEMMRARMRVVGIALSSIVNFLNPDIAVLGGGLVDEMPGLVLREVEAGMREYLVPEVSEALKIRRAALGGKAVALGAAAAALEKTIE